VLSVVIGQFLKFFICYETISEFLCTFIIFSMNSKRVKIEMESYKNDYQLFKFLVVAVKFSYTSFRVTVVA